MKQDPFSGVYRALSPKELAEMFMNPNAPKTEAEHWAVREIEKQRAEIERLREVLKIVRINGPDSNGLVWLSFSREGGVRVSFVVGHEEEMVSQALLEFEQIRRNALEGKP